MGTLKKNNTDLQPTELLPQGAVMGCKKGAAVDSEKLFHECPHCNIRCNCSSQPCCCCEEDFYDDIRDGTLQPMIPIEWKEQP